MLWASLLVTVVETVSGNWMYGMPICGQPIRMPGVTVMLVPLPDMCPLQNGRLSRLWLDGSQFSKPSPDLPQRYEHAVFYLLRSDPDSTDPESPPSVPKAVIRRLTHRLVVMLS